jgi:serine/threonine protein kinase
MNVVKLPPKVSSRRLLSRGDVGWVYQIDERIALKYPRGSSDRNFAQEIEMFNVFEKYPPCPDIVQSFLRVSKGNFLAFLSGGTLDQRIRAHQIRDDRGRRVLQVSKKEPIHLVERWIAELANANAWLESLGYVHADIRPPNLLLDGDDHLKLADFDCASRIGTESFGAAPPWARFLGIEGGSEEGTYGLYGPRTEQFSIGSILYYMTRGYEPYENELFDPDHGVVVVDRLQAMMFPNLSGGRLDQIIRRCWYGEFALLKDLADETKALSGAVELPRAIPLSMEYCLERRKECQRLVDGGLLAWD